MNSLVRWTAELLVWDFVIPVEAVQKKKHQNTHISSYYKQSSPKTIPQHPARTNLVLPHICRDIFIKQICLMKMQTERSNAQSGYQIEVEKQKTCCDGHQPICKTPKTFARKAKITLPQGIFRT